MDARFGYKATFGTCKTSSSVKRTTNLLAAVAGQFTGNSLPWHPVFSIIFFYFKCRNAPEPILLRERLCKGPRLLNPKFLSRVKGLEGGRKASGCMVTICS